MPRSICLLLLLLALSARAQEPVPYRVVGDGVPAPLAAPGDAARGRALLVARDPANCILCHGAPSELERAGVRFSGNLAPSLDGAGARWSVAQLRLRVVDSSRIHPQTIMPPYHRTEGLTGVGAAWRGRPILSAQQVEDLIAYLSTLK